MKRIVQFVTLVLTSIALMVVVSYAWFINSEFVDPQISGYSESAYLVVVMVQMNVHTSLKIQDTYITLLGFNI